MKGSRLLPIAVLLTATLGPRLALASAPTIDAAHQIAVDEGRLRVTTRWYGHLPGDEWTFAAPLPAGTQALDRGAHLTRDPDDGRVVGIRFDAPEYPLAIALEIPWTGGDSIVALPLPPEPGWQRIEVEGDHRLVPDADTAVLLHAGNYYGPSDLHVRARMRIDRGLDHRHPAGAAYLPGAVVREAGGAPARLESGAPRRFGLAVAAGGVFVGGLLVLTVIFRRSSSAVEVEEAEAFLESEYRDLSNDDVSETA